LNRRRHAYTDRIAELDALYAQLPTLECRGRCQASCGPIDMSATERRRIADQGVTIPPLTSPSGEWSISWTCPALTMLGTCQVHQIRPMICRLWGLVEAMACPYGCMPEGGWLDDTTAMELLARSIEIGGRTGTLDAPSVAQVRRLMADRRIAAMAAAVMRGGRPGCVAKAREAQS
jgi:hypothetical protein